MPPPAIDESTLTKSQLRKLNSLRKSVGNDVGGRAFVEWLAVQAALPRRTGTRSGLPRPCGRWWSREP